MAERVFGDEEFQLLEQWLANNDDSKSEALVSDLRDLISADLRAAYVLPANSAMAALHLPLQAIGVGPGDEIIVDPIVTFGGMAVMYQNAVPVFADVDARTFNMSVDSLRARITPRTRALICTHHFGSVCEMEEIIAVAKAANIVVIEDCSHALGATYKGVHAGLLGDFAAFSFNHRKQLSTGQGGFLVANNPAHFDRLNSFKFGRIPSSLSWNYAMSGLVAAVGIAQWKRHREYVAQDQDYARRYTEAIAGSSLLEPQKIPGHNVSSYHVWAAVFKGDEHGVDYDAFMQKLREFGGDYFLPSFIPTGTFGLAPGPVYRYPIFRDPIAYGRGCPVRCPLYEGRYDPSDGICPNAEYVVPRLLNTVLSPLKPDRMARYADALHNTIRYFA